MTTKHAYCPAGDHYPEQILVCPLGYELGMLLDNTGKPLNLWEDGTAGLTNQEYADASAEETAYCLEHVTSEIDWHNDADFRRHQKGVPITKGHTPLEWSTDDSQSAEFSAVIYGDSNTDNVHGIATVHKQPDGMHMADARYIVQACNAFPALVEALERVEQTVSHSVDCASRHPFGECDCFKSSVANALAQAKGEK